MEITTHEPRVNLRAVTSMSSGWENPRAPGLGGTQTWMLIQMKEYMVKALRIRFDNHNSSRLKYGDKLLAWLAWLGRMNLIFYIGDSLRYCHFLLM